MWMTPLDAPEPYMDDAVAFTTSTCPTCSMGRYDHQISPKSPESKGSPSSNIWTRLPTP